MKIIPYTEVNGSRTVSDDFIRSIWFKMVDEGTYKTVFLNGVVNSADGLVSFFKLTSNVVHFVFEGEDLVFMAWLNSISGGTAQTHFVGFRPWGNRAAEALSMSFKYWFSFKKEGAYIFDVLMGCIPVFNKRAINFCKSVGVIFIGDIPDFIRNQYASNAPVGVAVGYVKRGGPWAE